MEPLKDETRAWLDDAMREEALPQADRARLWTEISASVGAPVPVKPGLLDRAVQLRHVIGIATIVFVAGVVAGRSLSPSTPSTAPTAQPVPSVVPVPSATIAAPTPSSSVIAPAPSDSVAATPPPSIPSVTPSAIRSAQPTAASMDEVRIIIKAKRALDEKRPADALLALEEHERAFPHGSLAEERDALRVLALCAAGRATDGKAERATFLRAHPLSAYVDRVRAACVE